MSCRVIALFLGVTALVLVSACGLSGPEKRQWTEDVDLGEGRIITVKRFVEFNESNSLAGDAYNAVETKSTIEFTGDLASLPVWSEPLMALVLYQDSETGEWVVVATTTSCEFWNLNDRPKPPYWEFRLEDGVWRKCHYPLSPLAAPQIFCIDISRSSLRRTSLFRTVSVERATIGSIEAIGRFGVIPTSSSVAMAQ